MRPVRLASRAGPLLLGLNPSFILSPLAALPLAVYLAMAMRRVYRESAPRLVVKYLALAVGYLASVGGVVLAVLLAAILTA